MAKKAKNKKKNKPSSAEQVKEVGTALGSTQDDLNAHLYNAISDSNNPESRIRKIRNPFNPRSCLLNLLILIVVSIAIAIFICALMIDKFDFVVVIKDISQKFGITGFFESIRDWFIKIFKIG